MKNIFILLAAMAILGCSPNKYNEQWSKNGASGDDFAVTKKQCQDQEPVVSNAALSQSLVILEKCLQNNGWTKKTNI